MSFIDDVSARFKQNSSSDAFRAGAWDAFNRLGLPKRRDEAWKYTNVEAIMRQPWASATVGVVVPERLRQIRARFEDVFDVLIVMNGKILADESRLTAETSGCLRSGEPELSPAEFEDGFSGLHAALSQTAVHFSVPANTQLDRPVLILRGQSGDQSWVSSLSRIEIGARAQVTVAEIFVGEGEYLRGELAFAHLGQHARLDWLRIQLEDTRATFFGEARIEMGQGAVANISQINSGAKWSRSTLRVDVRARDAEVRIQGLSFGRDKQHIDQRVIVNHHAANTTSAQLFKSVLRDQARGVLNGKIFIAQDAQKVMSSQLNHSLLMGEGAEANTKPELEIYADDVKSNHGASIGRLDQDKIFYLQSRGITAAAAEQMLAEAFVRDVAMKIESKTLRALAEAQVGGGL